MKAKHFLIGGAALAALLLLLSGKKSADARTAVLSKQWFHPTGENTNYDILDVLPDGTVLSKNPAWIGKWDGGNQIHWKRELTGDTVTWTAA